MNSKQINDIIEKAIEFINDASGPLDENKFGEIALELYDLHREHNPTYAKYDKGPLTDWREIPLMPISEFKKNDVSLIMESRMPFPGVEFHSSGTTQGDKSKHRMYDTEAYRASIVRGLKTIVELDYEPKYRVVLLTPKLPHSSLYYMMQLISDIYDPRGVREEFDGMTDAIRVRDLVEGLDQESERVLLFGTSLAFYDLLSTISKLDIKPITLPEGSLIIETGGWKGRDIKITPRELTSTVSSFFGVPPMDCLREYSMSELSSQLWAWNYEAADVKYHAPYWLNYRLVDPLTQTEVKEGESGIIAFVDLANVWSCPFILTEDMGHLSSTKFMDTLVLEGRAATAPEKGCSLTYAAAMDN